MTTKHTPGPWRQGDACFEDMHNIRSNGHKIAEVDGGISTSIEEDHANAHLIAAAPDLLAALEAILDPTTNTDEALYSNSRDMARAAIAKAKGE